jgi:hypothetical protein
MDDVSIISLFFLDLRRVFKHFQKYFFDYNNKNCKHIQIKTLPNLMRSWIWTRTTYNLCIYTNGSVTPKFFKTKEKFPEKRQKAKEKKIRRRNLFFSYIFKMFFTFPFFLRFFRTEEGRVRIQTMRLRVGFEKTKFKNAIAALPTINKKTLVSASVL